MLEGLMALETGLFVLLHVPDSHSFRGERSQKQIDFAISSAESALIHFVCLFNLKGKKR